MALHWIVFYTSIKSQYPKIPISQRTSGGQKGGEKGEENNRRLCLIIQNGDAHFSPLISNFEEISAFATSENPSALQCAPLAVGNV